jgi:hypothetical protein
VSHSAPPILVAIPRDVRRDRVEPRSEGVFVTELGRAAIGAQERFLHDFLGLVVIPRQSQRHRVEARAIGSHHFFERPLGVSAEAVYELILFRTLVSDADWASHWPK